MATKFSVYLDGRRCDRQGLCSVMLRMASHGQYRMMSMGIKCDKDKWDSKLQRASGNDAYSKRLNLVIDKHLLRVRTMMMEREIAGLPTGVDDMYEALSAEQKPVRKVTVHEWYERLMGTKRGQTRELYELALKSLNRYCAQFDSLGFDEIDVRWLTEWDMWMEDHGVPKVNARSVYMRCLRAVYNYAIDNEVTQCYPFRRYKIRKEETMKRSLSVEDLRELITMEVEPHQEQYRDMFLLSFYLIGINMVDMLNLTEVRHGRVEFARSKTKRLYSIKVEPEAQAIIDRHRGEGYLLDALNRYNSHKNYTHRVNMNLGRLGGVERKGRGGKKVFTPRFPGLTTYWARHTWATIAASMDIPKETIAAALGHGGNTVTDVYINFDRRKIDEANRRVIDYVLQNAPDANVGSTDIER